MKTALIDRYLRSDDYATRIEGVTLPPEVWAVFAQLHQPQSAAELSAKTKLEVESVQAALRSLIRRKLARKYVIGWHDYAATQALTTPVIPAASSIPATPITAVTIHDVTPAIERPNAILPPATHSNGATNPSAEVPPHPAVKPAAFRVRMGSERQRRMPPAPFVQLRISPTSATLKVTTAPVITAAPAHAETPSTPAPSTATNGWRLRPVLDAIGAKAGGGLAGQLLIYRVFLQVAPELMQAGGLHSLSLVDEKFSVSHAPLRSAIANAARTYADVEIDSIFVP